MNLKVAQNIEEFSDESMRSNENKAKWDKHKSIVSLDLIQDGTFIWDYNTVVLNRSQAQTSTMNAGCNSLIYL